MRRPAAAVILTASLFTLLLTGTALAGPFEDAMSAYNRGDYKTAYRLFKPLAEQGYVQAQCYLGLMYAQGKGVPKNNAEAMKWFRKAAEKGDVSGQYALGKMYVRSQDYVEAMKWIRKAAEGGSANAQNYLAGTYDLGEVVPQDSVEAMKWWRRAADQGHAEAMYYLGYNYAIGEGVPQDMVQSYMWFTLLIDSRSPESGDDEKIAKMKKQGIMLRDGLANKSMTPEQIAEAQRLAREWKPKKER